MSGGGSAGAGVSRLHGGDETAKKVRGDVKNVGDFSGGGCLGRGGGGVWCPTTTFGKQNYHFLFLLPFDAFKTCKNTIERFNLCALPCLEVAEMPLHQSSYLA